jgi:serine phosphatase RsbU (regulator of sigma subunit)
MRCATKQLFCLIAFCFCTLFAYAEDKQKIDSIRALLKKELAEDSIRVNRLNDIAYLLYDYPDTCLYFAETALKISRKINYQFGEAKALMEIGAAHNAKGSYNLSFKYFYESYALFEKLEYKEAMINVMNSIANSYIGNKDYDKALQSYKLCRKLSVEVKNPAGIGVASFGIANIYGEKKILDSAYLYIDEAMRLLKSEGMRYHVSVCHTLKGQFLNTEKKYDLALESMNDALKILIELNQQYGLAATYGSMGEIHYNKGDKKNALEFYLLAYNIHLKRNAYHNLQEVCVSISDIYKDLGDFENAYEFHVKYTTYKDSIFNETSRKQLLETETKFQTAKKEKELVEKNLELEKSTNEIKTKSRFLIFFALVSIVFCVLGFFLYRQYKQKIKDNHRMSVQKTIIEEKNKSITDSIRYAQYIQESILPDDDMSYQLLGESFIYFKPKDIVSGDFYWIVSSGAYTYIAAVDCTGHGVPGAFMSMVGHNALNNAVKRLSNPSTAQVLSFLQDEVAELFGHSYRSANVRDGMDLSIIRLDRKNKALQFSGANNPIYHIRNKILTEYKADKIAISAKNENATHSFTIHEFVLEKGDCFYLFSDGYADQFGGPDGKKYKYSRLKETLISYSEQPMHIQRKNIDQSFTTWKGELEQVDDVLLIGIKI